ncbi:MAG TPA: glycosyltransferase family 9 protein [Caulobacteraceae bacterium]|jgi:ADP-heptose:LPS heptosyltransferase|nr:glycosyltransferase family 9 protein [Caulobacteraceae bacterium]
MAPRRFPILFVAPSRVGDAVLASGLVRTLREEIPEARFTFAASALTAPLFAEVPGLARLLVVEKRRFGRHWVDLWAATRGKPWGLVVDLRGSRLAAVLRPRRRAVHRPASGAVHKVVEAARLLKLEATPPAPFIFTSQETRARAAALCAGEGPILAVGPASNWIGKAWPAERYARLARALLDEEGPLAGGRLMVVGGPGDRHAAAPALLAVPRDRLIDLVGRADLLTVHAALAHARLYVGADSGLMHLAAAAGAPTLGLFGPSDERLYAPWGEQTAVVRGPRPFEAFLAADPRLDQALCHMMDLKLETVFDAAAALIERTRAVEPDAKESNAA